MGNFFESYLEWIITQYNDGEDILDILTSGYTANTETFYCPECSQYVLSSVETLYCEAGFEQVCPDYSSCCININANNNTYINFIESIGEPNFCCAQSKFCLETNLSPENLLDLLQIGVVEISSTSEIYNTNLCYLLERLTSEGFEEKVFLEICYLILEIGIVIWCYEGIIYANSMENYILFINSLASTSS